MSEVDLNKNFRKAKHCHKQHSTRSRSSIPPIEGYFSGLRRLARRLDNEVVNLGKDIGSLQSNHDSSDVDSTSAKHSLQLAQKAMRHLKSDVIRTREDLEMRSSSVIEASELFATLLDSCSERLESVETFMEKYGYTRPDVQTEEESPDSATVDVPPSGNPHSCTNGTGTLDSRANTDDEDNYQSEGEGNMPQTPPPSTACKENQRFTPPSPRTPQLKDFGLSEYTVSLFTRYQKSPKESSHTFKSIHSESALQLQTTSDQNAPQQDITCNIHEDENYLIQTPPNSKLNQEPSSSFLHSEMHTPQLKDFGLSGNVPFHERCNIINVGEKFYSSTTNRSPQTPELPMLSKNQEHEKIPLPDDYSDNFLTEPTTIISSKMSPSMPELPEMQTDRLNYCSDTEYPPHEVSLLQIEDRTPTMPVLSSKRY